MAIIKCSECGKEISDSATKCPHCGCLTISGKKGVNLLQQSIWSIMAIVCIILGCILYSRTSEWERYCLWHGKDISGDMVLPILLYATGVIFFIAGIVMKRKGEKKIKELKYLEAQEEEEWICPNCKAINPRLFKACKCGYEKK